MAVLGVGVRIGREAARRIESNTRRHGREVLNAGDALGLQRVAVERFDADGYLGGALFTPSR